MEAVTLSVNGQQTTPIPEHLLRGIVEQDGKEAAVEANKSRAQRRYERVTQGKTTKPRITTVRLPEKIDPEPWFVKRLALDEITVATLLFNRDAKGRLNLKGDGIMNSVYAASLFVACVTGSKDDTPFFESFAEAGEQIGRTEEDMVALNTALANKIHEINPEIMMAAIAEDARDAGAGEENLPLVPALASSTLPSETPSNGFSATPSTDAPS